MAYSNQIREEELKNKVAQDFFQAYDTTSILGNVDFCVAVPSNGPQLFETEYLMWAEAKKGNKSNIEESFVQLVITIGKAHTFEHHLPPRFLGAFDAEKIAFIPYNNLLEIFHQNDFNWNVTPSDHSTKEFALIHERVKDILSLQILTFNFERDKKELEKFIKHNFIVGKSKLSKIRISKNNFVAIYQKWLLEVKPTINVDWDKAKKSGIIDADFYLADILSEHNVSLKEKLFVLLRESYYELDRKKNDLGLFTSSKANFLDEQKAHNQFWNRYSRPPKREYWDYIVERRDLLVPPDVRERKGSFFTPQKWVELSQQYLADELGENWQDEYYIWDCAAGTGNLLNGLTNKYRIWASTLDKADVDVMKERIKNGSANLLDEHVFQFDFLNDSFDKLPPRLKEIIDNEETRKKLVIYINPPYAEAATTRQKTGTGKNKPHVSRSIISAKYKESLGSAVNELYAQFLMRIYHEIPSSVLANFSTLKNLQAPNFRDFRNAFRAKLGRIFLVPADSFDNVKGNFPIGFFIWNLNTKEDFREITADVYDRNSEFTQEKILSAPIPNRLLMDWLKSIHDKKGNRIAYLRMLGSDIQNNNGVFITNTPSPSDIKQRKTCDITEKNIIGISVYCSVRNVIKSSWLNDRDQYLFPSSEWELDELFQNDCLTYSLFYGQNRVNIKGENHWIPFTEEEVGARDCFKSHFMTEYISGKNRPFKEANMFENTSENNKPLEFSKEAIAVFDAGRELWRYYHSQPDSNPDASLYDIKLYFQGTKTMKNGKIQMKSNSEDKTYTELIHNLRDKLKILASKIEPKIYEYGFLKS
ncbi:MAG: hypothetical protein K2M88_00375 [Muribaculaceae bacterium]|nr:hypothetical protein [Muribaculaceae bacterium]